MKIGPLLLLAWSGLAATACSDATPRDISDAAPDPEMSADEDIDAEGRFEADASFGQGDGGVVSESCEGDAIALTAPPAGFPPLPQPSSNPTTRAGVALGRRLFFDPRLSADGTVSCATCHVPLRGFSDGQSVSTRGISGNPLIRNTPSLWNVAWFERGLFWDGGSKNLESLSLAPLTHPDEMGREGMLEEMLAELALDATYATSFGRAFGEESLTLGSLLRALAQFQRTLVAADSRWDRRSANPLSETESAGEAVFTRHCARCHVPGLFTDGDFHNNGLGPEFVGSAQDPRQGRARVSLSATDRGKFKTPGLHDVDRSAPYMHDGRFTTLKQVIEHYRRGMIASATLDEGFLQGRNAPGVTMTDLDAKQLQAFLGTLSQEREFSTELTCPSD